MKRNTLAIGLSQALLCSALLPGIAAAQQKTPDGSNADVSPADPQTLDRIVVQGEIQYRNRSSDTAPVLSYDLEYFQRFEPATVGDMLKRVPSAVFVSDVLEYDGVQLRGLDPGYTQVLINGKKVPGAGDDRSFWVDRIPAEMVERIEILRSNSANRSGDAIAGALNIILRDAWQFDGSYLRLGALRYDDGELQPTFGAVTSGEALGGRLLAGINVQDRYNPKRKRSDRFEGPGGDFVDAEDQSDIRDGKDYSANFSYVAEPTESSRLTLDGFFVRTDRDQVETSLEYDAPTPEAASKLTQVPGLAEIRQDNWGLALDYRFDMAGGRTALEVSHARFADASREGEEEISFEDGQWDGHEAEALAIDAADRETGLKLSHQRNLAAAALEFGLDYRRKQRGSTHSYYAFEAEQEGDPVVYSEDAVVRSRISETRLDPYLMLSGKAGSLGWETGLRLETTRSTVSADNGAEHDSDNRVLLPSLHLKWDIGQANRINLSLARSLRRPGFNQMLPATLEGEYGDNDFIGNPQLKPETANGVDLGFERRLGKRGVIGLNLFYRDVRDLIEIVNTGLPSTDALDSYEEDLEEFLDANPGSSAADFPIDPDSFVYTVANVGKGKVHGVEFDLSTPLTALGLPDTGVFLNYSWLDSKVSDFLGERRFNNQARSVYNVGFIQELPTLAASFGATWRKQGDAFSRILAEEVLTRYGADLEVFVEKRFGQNLSLRLSGSNLHDARKDEVFDKFDNLEDQIERKHDEYELETESAGPRYQLTLRWAF